MFHPPPPPPALNNDAIVSSEVNGVTLQHRAAVSAPKQFKPIGEEYRSLYAASIMSSPNYTGTAVGSLDNAAAFYALGEVENSWLAISAIRGGDLVGYIQANAGVPEARYKSTLRKDLPRRARAAKQDCVKVGGDSKACKTPVQLPGSSSSQHACGRRDSHDDDPYHFPLVRDAVSAAGRVGARRLHVFRQNVPSRYSLVFDADRQVNAAGAQPAPIKIRVLLLRSDAEFMDADFFSLQNDAKSVLGNSLLDSDQFFLTPGQTGKSSAGKARWMRATSA